MPRSGGGGSHSGGGHHSSGGHHSGGSHGGSRRSGSSSSGTYRSTGIRRTYYPGSHRYVVYNRNRAPEYIFSDKTPKEAMKQNKIGAAIFAFIGIVYMIIGAGLLFGGISTPKKLSGQMSGHAIVDEAGILGDTEELSEIMDSIYDITGIYQMFLTVNNETWQKHYDDLYTYAFERYVTDLPDETCWLTVYSQPATDDDGFVDWYWETIIGDDTVQILHDEVLEDFENKFQSGILLYGANDIDTALAEALTAIEPSLMKTHANSGLVGMGVFWIAISLLISGIGITVCMKNRRFADAIACPVDENSKEIVKEAHCEYCNSIYIVGTVHECPNCGAPLKTLADFNDS